MKKARKSAKARRTSVSRGIEEQVVAKLKVTWPAAVLDAAGALPDFPSLEEIRKGYGRKP